MTALIDFFIPGIPKGQPRPRAFAFHGKARVYDPGTAEGWKSEIAIAAKPHRPPAPLEGPLEMALHFHFPRPKAHFCKTGLKLSAPALHTAKPDADNAAKAVLDALTTLGFWHDDSQVAMLEVSKFYAVRSRDFQPGCEVIIYKL